MTGHRPFSDLTKSFTPARRAQVAAKAAALREEMTLADALAVGQPAVAKLEERTDMHVSNPRRYIEALGGKLEITARFSDASVNISNIGDTTTPHAGE